MKFWHRPRRPPARRRPAGPQSLFGSPIIFIVLMVVMMYFILFRPQQQQRKRQEKLLQALKSGDKVVTSSGIVGLVITVKDKTVSLRSADAKMEVTKSRWRKSSKPAARPTPRPSMKNNDFWKFILVAFIICWSLYEMYPPTSRDLVKEFETRAENKDATFAGHCGAAGTAAKGPARPRVRQSAGGHRHQRHPALFPLLSTPRPSWIRTRSS